MVCGKYSFLVDHGYICGLDLILNILVDMLVIPCSGFILAGLYQTSMVKIVSYSDNSGGRYFRSIGLFFCFCFFYCSFFFCSFCRLLYQIVVKLEEKDNQNDQNCHRAEKGNPGITFFSEIERYIFIFFHGRFLYINFVDFLIYYSKKSALLTSAAEMLLVTPKMKF